MITKRKTKLRLEAESFFKQHRKVRCPAFPGEKVVFNSKGISHLFYKGAKKVFSRAGEDTKTRISLLPQAIKILRKMPLAQEETTFEIEGKHIRYWAFEAVIDDRRIKVIVRQVGDGTKHFWSVIPAWRKQRGARVNARGNLSRQ